MELSTTILIPILSAVGAAAGIIAKDFLAPLTLERQKRRRALEQTYCRYKDPLVASALELAHRLNETTKRYPANYLNSDVLNRKVSMQVSNSNTDPYYLRHKLVSTLYRFCSFFGWLELYRQEITFLNSGNEVHARELEIATNIIRSDIADGHINMHPDWDKWRDTLIFREELRAIGEAMIDSAGPTHTVIGYGKFLELIELSSDNAAKHWTNVVKNFVLDPESQKDFRKARMERLLYHLICLVEILEPGHISNRLDNAKKRVLASTDAWPDGLPVETQPNFSLRLALLSLSA